MGRRQIWFALLVVAASAIWGVSSLRTAYPQATTSPSGRRRLRGYHNQSIAKREKQQATILQQVDWSSLSIDEGTGVRRFVQMDNNTPSIYSSLEDQERDRTASCHDGESFTLLSPQQPLVQRCYRAQGEHTGEYLYASGDHVDSGELVIAAAQIGGDDLDDVRWILLSIDPRAYPSHKAYCYSTNYAREVHPAQASWMCDITGENHFDHSRGNFEASCSCSVSPSTASIPLKSRIGWQVGWFIDNWMYLVVLATLFSLYSEQFILEGSGQAVLRR